MIFATSPMSPHPLRAAIRQSYLADETETLGRLIRLAQLESGASASARQRARGLIERVRTMRRGPGGIDAFLHEYSLNTDEGVVLMCLAEALLRVPDAATAGRLIEDRLAAAHWEQHLGHSHSLYVNASTWGLMLSGKLFQLNNKTTHDLRAFFGHLIARIGEPAVRLALRQAMTILGHQFVMGRSIEEALQRARTPERQYWRYSFDMLGEAALTAADAERYFEAYRHAIAAVGAVVTDAADIFDAHSVSVKLSALHPRFEFSQHERVMRELAPRVQALVQAARDSGIGITLDAEETDRLEPMLDIFESVYHGLHAYEGFGLTVQSYQKRALPVIEWLIALAHTYKRRIPLRLVKGAYWDSEIKRAQERGLKGYPVFTHKTATDVSYLACARRMLKGRDDIFPQFATHNAHTISAILELVDESQEFEFQRLYGMGEALYGEIAGPEISNVACRVYSPVGSHEDLLPYLVRRLLENGANTSFLHQVLDNATPVNRLITDPVEKLISSGLKPNRHIPLPAQLYAGRLNSPGVNLHDVEELQPLAREMEHAAAQPASAAALIGGQRVEGPSRPVLDPADRRRITGHVVETSKTTVDDAFALAAEAQPAWDAIGADERAAILERGAELLERDRAQLLVLLVREGGKCLADADAEVREAADYCRYYAQLARNDFAQPKILVGTTGEHNELQLHGRGVFACMSPWNFPLAIFIGQVTAALAAGNSVIAKPAMQTPLVAYAAVKLLHEAGVPSAVLHFLPGPSTRIGARILGQPQLGGVAFTGSTDTAQSIHRQLAARAGAIVPLIAETGGLNAMIADSSALPEQLVPDALRSAFNSAGQRCSALRVLFLQEELAARVVPRMLDAVAELVIGDPALISTDIGPLIGEAARTALDDHAERMLRYGKLLVQAALPHGTEFGSFFAPRVFEIPRLDLLQREVFGPILHIVRFSGNRLDEVIDAINRSGYGLTLGIHSRIEATARYIQSHARVGNTYVNRNQIGAVVGVQPFGGERLSGTGPKAGGPHYLLRFATERTFTINTAAVGGNATLLSMDDEDLAQQ